MEKQSYKNHIRYYPPHHFVYYPVIITFLAFSVYFIFTTEEKLIWTFISGIFAVLFWLAFMLRQHYALTLQNRIVRLEVKYRYFVLTGKRLEKLRPKLKSSQIFALRFAPDSELERLAERAIAENLTATAIKKEIKNWKGDYHRV